MSIESEKRSFFKKIAIVLAIIIAIAAVLAGVFGKGISGWLKGNSASSNGDPQVNITQLKTQYISSLTNKIYDKITQNIESTEPSLSNSMKSSIESWLDSTIDSTIISESVENGNLMPRIFISSGKPDSSSNLSKGDTVLDHEIQAFGFQTKDENWWIRLRFPVIGQSESGAMHEQELADFAVQGNRLLDRFMKIKTYSVSKHEFIKDSALIQPASIGVGIEKSIPYTYNATLEQSAIYLETLQLSGWKMQSLKPGAFYLDFYLARSGENARVIILDGSLKVFNWGTQK
ncbi:hypothetical protein ACFQZE_10955 [Paenibacillus sp. GCM10027627]|uniref:hypothetical protein n=1 Tax=unclassified Paenibacillus TaxID=185978 RepID=UPI00364268B6